MANTSKNKANKVPKTIEEEKNELLAKNKKQEDLISDLTRKNQESEHILEQLQKQMQDMQMAFIKMQSGNVSNVNSGYNSNRKFYIGCRLVNGVTVYSPKREIERRIPYSKNIEFNEQEMELLLKSPFVREFLRKDILYFTNVDDYEYCKVYDRVDLGDEILIEMVLDYEPDVLRNELNKLTREKKDHPVMHSIFYRLCYLYNQGKIIRMTYDNRKIVEDFFKASIENSRMLIERVEKVKK